MFNGCHIASDHGPLNSDDAAIDGNDDGGDEENACATK